MQIHSFSFTPVSMLTRENPQRQRVELEFDTTQAGHVRLEVRQGRQSLEYCVARYEDRGLESHTPYYYRLRAVSTTGARGAFSEVLCGITREM